MAEQFVKQRQIFRYVLKLNSEVLSKRLNDKKERLIIYKLVYSILLFSNFHCLTSHHLKIKRWAEASVCLTKAAIVSSEAKGRKERADKDTNKRIEEKSFSIVSVHTKEKKHKEKKKLNKKRGAISGQCVMEPFSLSEIDWVCVTCASTSE